MQRTLLLLISSLGCTEPPRSGKATPDDQPADSGGAIRDSAEPDEEEDEGEDTGCPEPSTFFADEDGDGFGDPDRIELSCTAPSGFVEEGTDCDDADPLVHPSATEICDPIDQDEDCDGLSDDADPEVDTTAGRRYYLDRDGDGHGDIGHEGRLACDIPATTGWSHLADDCDDAAPAVFPGADEVCDGLDNDCDGVLDLCPDGPTSLSFAPGRLLGEAAGDQAGDALSLVGDVDGDGLSDLVIGAPGQDAQASDAGAAYLVLGPATSHTSLSTARARILGDAASDRLGAAVAGGDADGDGLSDLLISAWKADMGGVDVGAVYLFMGPLSGEIGIRAAEGMAWGEADRDSAGQVVAMGDLDGDALSDLVVGAPLNSGAASNAGAVYVLSGPLTVGLPLALSTGRRLGMATDDFAGSAVAVAGDVDGDGIGDLLVGAQHADLAAHDAGAVYLVHGPVTGTEGLAGADAILLGEQAFDYAGWSVAGPGDVDGDGYDDVLTGAPCHDNRGSNEGAAYLVRGPLSGPSSLALADAKLLGETSLDQAGQHVGEAGDTDGDGLDDLLLASSRQSAAGLQAGAIWVLPGPLSGTLSLSTLGGKHIGEQPEDRAGTALSGGQDLDGDGLDDVLIGSIGHDGGGADAGAAWILLGALP